MEVVGILISSAVVSAIVGALAGYWSQRRLAINQAELDYQSAARRRLYEALGPLRFQLLVAARDVIRRVRFHHESPWNMDTNQYYANSFIYRLLRPLALTDLVQRQMAVVDFSVDPTGRELLRFDNAAYHILTGNEPVAYYRNLDHGRESHNVFRDNLRLAAATLIERDESGAYRVLDYSEFLRQQLVDDPALVPIRHLFESCRTNLTENGLWWVRVVGYAYACQWLIDTQGAGLGFEPNSLDVRAMLGGVSDDQIAAHLVDYPSLFDAILAEPL